MKVLKPQPLTFVTEKQILDSESFLQKVGTFLNVCTLFVLLGLLSRIFSSYENPFSSDLFVVLLGLFVITLVNLILLAAMQRLGFKIETAEIDKLTKLFNRRAFENILTKELHRAGRYHYPLSLCMVDIDGFRALNEHYGKTRGDEILKAFSTLMHRTVRSTDYASRYHSDEFCVLLPHTDLMAAEKFLRRFMAQAEEQIDISFSAGATLYLAGENKTQFLIRVKSALDQAKQDGKKKIFGIVPQSSGAQNPMKL
jgi:diguanylate cyclase (GGDEF)-like protein